MANINLSWVPANDANSIGQRASTIAKVNGATPNMTTGFTPSNIMGKAVSSAVFNTSNNNIVYRFKVETICSVGGPTANTNGIIEQIVFACIIPLVKGTDLNTTSYTIRLLRGAYTQIDGVNYPNSVSSIDNIEYSLYNAANTGSPIQGPFLGNITGAGTSGEAFEYTFTGLTASTSYTVRSVLIATVNGVSVRSDAAQYLNNACNHPVTTNSATAPLCVNYQLQNFQTNQSANYTYTDCSGATITDVILASSTKTFCAIQGSISAPGAVQTQIGNCSNGVPCFNYTLDNPSINNSGSYTYIDCGGVTRGPFTLAHSTTDTVCAKQGTVTRLSGTVNITSAGFC